MGCMIFVLSLFLLILFIVLGTSIYKIANGDSSDIPFAIVVGIFTIGCAVPTIDMALEYNDPVKVTITYHDGATAVYTTKCGLVSDQPHYVRIYDDDTDGYVEHSNYDKVTVEFMEK